jgi:hypothetical protein
MSHGSFCGIGHADCEALELGDQGTEDESKETIGSSEPAGISALYNRFSNVMWFAINEPNVALALAFSCPELAGQFSSHKNRELRMGRGQIPLLTDFNVVSLS